MPPRTRGAVKAKENSDVVGKQKLKSGKIRKQPRKVLADKTNSASDDNASHVTQNKVTLVNEALCKPRTRRDRRLPARFANNEVLINLSNSKENILPVNQKTIESLVCNDNRKSEEITFKTPSKLKNSLVANRPKRICKLSTRLEDHSVSPNKFISVKPCHTSTPILLSKKSNEARNVKQNLTKENISIDQAGLDTWNNQKHKTLKSQKNVKDKIVQNNITSVDEVINKKNKRVLSQKNENQKTSIKILENKRDSQKKGLNDADIYEFTYDPNEEPPPMKKKRKRVVKKKPAPTKPVFLNNNYDMNMRKVLTALKNIVSKKPETKTVPIVNNNVITAEPPQSQEKNTSTAVVSSDVITQTSISKNIVSKPYSNPTDSVNNVLLENVCASIRVEDIAADFEPTNHTVDHHNDLNYSPVNSPHRPDTPEQPIVEKPFNVKDPLNLRDELSFFDENPIASSSMNVSVRDPIASPWRVEFSNLPIKWQANTYVKANMTPAVESSFINSEDMNKKKHVYTNLIPQSNDTVPVCMAETCTPNYKQTSIISFIREVAERSERKKHRGQFLSPTKANSLFENITNTSTNYGLTTPQKVQQNTKESTPNKNNSNSSNNSSKENSKENSTEGQIDKNGEVNKSHKKKKDKDITFFGFDESTDDQENISPVKINPRARALRPRSKAVLQEINAQTGPTRAALPARTKIATSSDAVNRVYEELKSATDAPIFPEKTSDAVVSTVVEEALNDEDDSQSVHLFEDIEVVHHLKPTRKSYGKAKKVKFQQGSSSDSDLQVEKEPQSSEDEDDLADLTFHMPLDKKKKPKKKKPSKNQMSKKEQQEAEAWAAGFNSMCEDVEEFPLLIE